MREEMDILEEIERNKNDLYNLSEVEEKILDRIVEINDEIEAFQSKHKILEDNLSKLDFSADIKRINEMLVHIGLFIGAFTQIDGKLKKVNRRG